MKSTRFLYVLLLSGFITSSFAQPDLVSTDQSEAVEPTIIAAERTNTAPKEVVFGYHHGNYKHPVKANMARKWFTVRGAVNRQAVTTNYKQPFGNKETVQQTPITIQPKVRTNRNYKTPYSSN